MLPRPSVKLYGYWRSTSSWRVRLVLALKRIEYDNQPVHLLQDGGQQRTESFLQKNPMMQVPVLEWTDHGQTRRLGQSVAICEYLNERFPHPPLLPDTPDGRARVRQVLEVINSGIQPLQNLAVLQNLSEAGIDRVEWSNRWIRRGFEALETMLQPSAGRFCFGDQMTLADTFLVPQMYNARRFEVDLAPFPTLVRIDGECAEDAAFQAAHPDQQPDAKR